MLRRSISSPTIAHEKRWVDAAAGTDYLDLMLLHWPFADYYRAWRELEALYRAGAVRTIGVSNFEPDRLVDLIAYNEDKPAVDQIETHLYCQRQTEHAWEEKYGVAHMAYALLGQGKADEIFVEPVVRDIAAKYGKSPAQVLLRRTYRTASRSSQSPSMKRVFGRTLMCSTSA